MLRLAQLIVSFALALFGAVFILSPEIARAAGEPLLASQTTATEPLTGGSYIFTAPREHVLVSRIDVIFRWENALEDCLTSNVEVSLGVEFLTAPFFQRTNPVPVTATSNSFTEHEFTLVTPRYFDEISAFHVTWLGSGTGNCNGVDMTLAGSAADVTPLGFWNIDPTKDVYFEVFGVGDEPGIKRPVILIPGILGSFQKNGVWQLDPILHTYTDLSETLEANGYVPGETLWGFPYNWYQSNVITAQQLKSRIDFVKSICSCSKIDIVAHSMGGLIVRQYIQSNEYENDVENIIFLGTPHLGAPKSYLVVEGGTLPDSFQNNILLRIVRNQAKQLGYNSVFDFVNGPFDSIEELLPTYHYLKSAHTGELFIAQSLYPQNGFLALLNENIDKLNSSGVKITNIVGKIENDKTIKNIRVVPSTLLPLWLHGYPVGFDEKIGDMGLEVGEGDETVPLSSAQFITKENIEIVSEHTLLPKASQAEVYKILTGLEPTHLVEETFLPDAVLFFKMFSPADMQIVAPDGKRIGKDFDTDQEVNEIPYAFYSGFETHDEFITILNPMDGEYKLVTQGTDEGGEYKVSVALVSEDAHIEEEITASTVPGLIENISVSIFAEQGQIEVAPEDQDGPEINIVSPEPKDYLRSDNLTININVSDSSGVFSSEFMVDNITVDNSQVLDLLDFSLGLHSISVKAVDLLGNESTSSVSFRVIATKDSIISDIEKCYQFGWITSESVYNSLKDKLNSNGKNKHKDFIKLLDAQRNKNINNQAYNLLIEDINWLINNPI